jgi:hypothetical protein
MGNIVTTPQHCIPTCTIDRLNTQIDLTRVKNIQHNTKYVEGYKFNTDDIVNDNNKILFGADNDGCLHIIVDDCEIVRSDYVDDYDSSRSRRLCIKDEGYATYLCHYIVIYNKPTTV